jgi:hypothetical protein
VLAREMASPWHEAYALEGLGQCAPASGHAAQAQAQDLLRLAIEMFR